MSDDRKTKLRAVYSVDHYFIPLKYIEALKVHTSEEDEVINKLKGDRLMKIRTLSGGEYLLSMKLLIEMLGDHHPQPADVEEMQELVTSEWMNAVGIS